MRCARRALLDEFSDAVRYVKPAAGMFLMIDLSPFLRHKGDRKTVRSAVYESEAALWESILENTRVNLTPGAAMHCSKPGWFRVCLAYNEPSVTVKAIRRVLQWVVHGQSLVEPFWRSVAPTSIPSKDALHPAFCTLLSTHHGRGSLLDIGCGDGRITLQLARDYALVAVGVDVNENAIASALQALASRVCQSKSRPSSPPDASLLDSTDAKPLSTPPRHTQTLHANSPYRDTSSLRPVSFHVADCRSFRVADVPGLMDSFPEEFDVVLLQLLISVVGTPEDRIRMLENAFAQTKPGGFLLVSASADSADVNEEYRRLYAEAGVAAREPRTVRLLPVVFLLQRGSCF
eukprot:m.458689 g.458689  ORF g.458689 m.458689 type:complete len:347 (-) comp21582_c0_seq31:2332-3372(-)